MWTSAEPHLCSTMTFGKVSTPILQSPAATEVQVGSKEPHATPSVHEEIPATSAEENVNEELKTQVEAAEDPEIP